MLRSKALKTTAFAVVLCLALVSAAERARGDETSFEVPSPAALWLKTLRPDETLQKTLDDSVEAARHADPSLKRQTIRVSLMDLPVGRPPTLAHWNGDLPVYPASVPKFAYLMAAYHWRDQGRLVIDRDLDRNLQAMVYSSSNRATQKVVSRLTDTEPGPRLEPEKYAEFVERRHAVKRWLRDLGITDLHLVHPTYDGGGDLYGRDEQFLEDEGIDGCLPDQRGEYRNRAAMTSDGTAELLALLATDRALSSKTSAEVRERMRRSTRKQSYLAYRIAGGAEACGVDGVEVFAKTGTWGPIHADAGIVRAPSGRQLVVSVFIEGSPRYRGAFIAEITKAACRRVFARERGAATPVAKNIH
jgi:beta-lactamase class A